MNEVLKQRLVGALILVALGVVFWPIIFVEPGDRGDTDEARIPPRPAISTVPIEPPDSAGLRPSPELERAAEPADLMEPERLTVERPESGRPASGRPASGRPASGQAPAPPPVTTAPAPAAPPATRSEPPVKPALDAQGIPITWILRVASVSSADKSDALRQDLLAMGHKAYVQKVRSGDRTLYRVYIGPKAEKAKLEKLRQGIDAKFGVASMITRYYP